MNLFEINFLGRMTTLLKEAFKFKKYKAMHPVSAVFTGILMLPIVVASFVVTAILAAVAFAFSVISAPVKYLHGIVNHEGKSVMHATQFIVYFISWPLVFALYAVMGLFLLCILPLYALLSFLLYVWTLGGFKFHLFPSVDDDISIEVNGRYVALPIVFASIGGFVLILVAAIHGVIHYVDLYAYYMEGLFVASFFGGIYPMYVGIHSVFSVLYSLIGFCPRPNKKAEVAEVETIEIAIPEDARETVE